MATVERIAPVIATQVAKREVVQAAAAADPADDLIITVQALAECEIPLQVVPARFIRPEQELAFFCPHSSLCVEPIPMIDLKGLHDFRRQFTMAAISSACRHWGCFQVVNHEVPQSVLDDALGAAREFFEMSSEEKQAHCNTADYASGYGMQSVEAIDKVLDWGDVIFHKNMDTSWPAKPATYKYVCKPLRCVSETLICPKPYFGSFQNVVVQCADLFLDVLQRTAMEAYARETRKVLESLLDVISKELRLAPTYFRTAFGDFEQPLRVNYYPPCPQPELVLGLRAHTDPIALTAVLEDQTRGLQVKHGDKWVPVDPEPDALVIFVGDQLQVPHCSAQNCCCCFVIHSRGGCPDHSVKVLIDCLVCQISSNGRCKAVLHRTVANKKSARISIAMGLAPNAKARVRPTTELVENSAPARCEARTYAEYRTSLPSGVRW